MVVTLSGIVTLVFPRHNALFLLVIVSSKKLLDTATELENWLSGFALFPLAGLHSERVQRRRLPYGPTLIGFGDWMDVLLAGFGLDNVRNRCSRKSNKAQRFKAAKSARMRA